MNYKKLIGIGFSLLLAGTIVGCSGGEELKSSNNEQEEEAVNNDIAAIVNDEAILKQELDDSVENMKMTYIQQGIDIEQDGKLEEIQNQVLDQLINTKLVMQEVQKTGYEPTQEEVNDQIDQITSQFKTKEEMDAILEANNLTLDELKSQISDDLKVQKFIAENTTQTEPTEEELKELYDQYSQQNGDFPDYEELKEQLKQEVVAQKEQQQLMDLIEELRDQSEIEILI